LPQRPEKQPFIYHAECATVARRPRPEDRGEEERPLKGKTMNGIGRRAFVAGSAAAMLTAIGRASAQEYPSRPITFIVPFPPGGSTTIVARSISDRLGELLGQQLIIDNRAGAGGTVGTKALAKSDPDGYTIGLGYSGTLAIGPNLYSNVGYDPRKDFAAIGRIATAPNTLVVHPSFPAKNVAELIAYAKANPGKVNYGSAGVGTVSHVCGEYFANAAGVKLVHVPYKGTGPALTDLIGGHILVAFAPIPATYENAKKGNMRMLAVTSATRSTLAPEIPTIAEQGISGFEAVLRYGVVAPYGTPPAVVARLNKALNAALTSDEIRKRLALEGAEPLPSTPAEYAADIDREETLWGKIVKASGAKAD
jgi:tripartite-type tricarboxylate transporter receptor subunit TctC